MSNLSERYWRNGFSMKGVRARGSGAIYWHIIKPGLVKDKTKAHFDYEGPERVDENSLRGRLTDRGEDIPQDCEAIIIQGGEKLSRMLDETRFGHLSEYILPFPGCPSKKYIWLGRDDLWLNHQGAIFDLILSSFRQPLR
jgi:hypothetical protein